LGLAVPGMRISGEGCVGKSFPGFWEVLEGLYRNSTASPGKGAAPIIRMASAVGKPEGRHQGRSCMI
jgi:hypothetical protein